MAPSTPPPLLKLLFTKHRFVKSCLDENKIPTPQQLAQFLQSFVVEATPHIKTAPPAVGASLKAGLEKLGWSVATNSPIAGSAPPQPENVLAFIDTALHELMPDLATARAAAAATLKALQAEERDISLREEDYNEGNLSAKELKEHKTSVSKLPGLRAAAEEAKGLVSAIEAFMPSEELEVANAAEAAAKNMESMQIAQRTKEAAAAAAGGGGKGGGGSSG